MAPLSNFIRRSALLWALTLAVLWIGGPGVPERAAAQPAATPAASPNDPFPLMIPQIKTASEVDRLEKSVADAVAAEKENLDRLRTQRQSVEAFRKELATEINGYHLQLTSHANLLASPAAGIGAVEKARAAHQSALTRMGTQLADLAQRREAVRQRLEAAESQYSLNQKQLTEINAQTAEPARTQAMVERLQTLIRLLARKINLLEDIDAVYTEAIVSLEELQTSFRQLVPKFEETLLQKRKEVLFERKGLPLLELTGDRIQSALAEIRSSAGDLFTRGFRISISGWPSPSCWCWRWWSTCCCGCAGTAAIWMPPTICPGAIRGAILRCPFFSAPCFWPDLRLSFTPTPKSAGFTTTCL